MGVHPTMYTRTIPTFLFLAAIAAITAVLAVPASAQRGPKAAPVLNVPTEPGIAWFGSWEEGLAAAKRTDRPIFLMSATPQCNGVPGMW